MNNRILIVSNNEVFIDAVQLALCAKITLSGYTYVLKDIIYSTLQETPEWKERLSKHLFFPVVIVDADQNNILSPIVAEFYDFSLGNPRVQRTSHIYIIGNPDLFNEITKWHSIFHYNNIADFAHEFITRYGTIDFTEHVTVTRAPSLREDRLFIPANYTVNSDPVTATWVDTSSLRTWRVVEPLAALEDDE